MRINVVASTNSKLTFPDEFEGREASQSNSQFIVQVYRRHSKKLEESPIKGKVTLEDEEKMKRLLSYTEAPQYLQHNPYILSGYRGYLTTKLCIERFVVFSISVSYLPTRRPSSHSKN